MLDKLTIAMMLLFLSACQVVTIEKVPSQQSSKQKEAKQKGAKVAGIIVSKLDVDIVYNKIQSEFNFGDIANRNNLYSDWERHAGFKHIRIPGVRYSIVDNQCGWKPCALSAVTIEKTENGTRVSYEFSHSSPSIPKRFEEVLLGLGLD